MAVVESGSTRLHSLDGLRGLAAFSVVVTHYAATFFPHAVFGFQGQTGHQWQDALSRSPAMALYGGSFAVFIFFALSGFVIAKSAVGSRTPLVLLVGRRYARLTVPALFSTVLAYVLLHVYPNSTQLGASELANGWLASYYKEMPSLFQATWDAVFNPYRFGTSATNRVLWTMRNELFGSVGIYVLYRLTPPRFIPALLVLFSIVAIPQGPLLVGLLGFSGGALIYEAWARHYFRPRIAGPLLFSLGFLLGGLPTQAAEGTHFGPLVSFVQRFTSPFEFILSVAALLFVAGILMWPAAQHLLQRSVFRFLGRISFSLYLVHFPFLATVVLSCFLGVRSSTLAFVGLSLFYFAFCIAAAYLLTIALDEPTVATLQRATSLPKSKAFWLAHVALLAALLTFVATRIGFDPAAGLVLTIAYSGSLFLTPVVVLTWARRRAALVVDLREREDR